MTDLNQNPTITLPTIHLLYSAPDLPAPVVSTLSEKINAIEHYQAYADVQLTWEMQEAQKSLGQIRFGDHEVQIAGISTPLLPEIIDRTIHVSLWQPQIKAAMRHHQAHLSLVYTGENPDPVEKMIALYKVAHSYQNENLLGIANNNAWTAHPSADFLTPEKITSYRQELPFILWVGYVKFFIDKQHYWLITKGHHIFDVPDLAYLIQPGEDDNNIINQFINIFYYIYEQDAVVLAGDTLAIADTKHFIRFTEVSEHEDFLMGPAGTLVIEKISQDEANP